MTKLNPSPAENRRQALRTVDATGSLDGVHAVMARRFQAKGYIRKEGGKVTLTKMGKAVMEGRIGKAGRGAVDMGSARHKAERGWDGRRRKATGSSMAAYMTGDGTTARKKMEREERAFFESEGDRLKAEWDKEQAAHRAAVKRILGPQGVAHAVKIARADGTPFHRAELEGLQVAGWEIHPGGTIAAQVGKALKGVRQSEFNPADPLEKALGPESETRAVVLVAQGITEETLHQLRGAGYDLSSAPKRLREAEVKTNPTNQQDSLAYAEELSRKAEKAMGDAFARSHGKGANESKAKAHDLAVAAVREAETSHRRIARAFHEGGNKAMQRRHDDRADYFRQFIARHESASENHRDIARKLAKNRKAKVERFSSGTKTNPTRHISPAQIKALREEWEKVSTVPPAADFRSKWAKLPTAALLELAEARIKFVSALARNEVTRRALALNPTDPQPGLQKRLYELLKKGPWQVADLTTKTGHSASEVETALDRLGTMGLAHPAERTMFGATWRIGGLQQGLAFNTTGHKRPRAATPHAQAKQAGTMTNAKPSRKAPAKAKKTAAKVAKKPAAIGPDKVQPLKTQAAMKHRMVTALDKLLKSKPAPVKGKAKAKKTTFTPEKFTLTGRFNPTAAGDLARVWNAWTGTDPDQTLTFDVENPSVLLKTGGRVTIPENVVVLGRVAKFITKGGRLADFGANGPLMVTDAKAERIWLLAEKPFHFDLEPSVIAYLARKPKFGDRGTIEYVHGFKGRVRAVMAGQVGAMTGAYRITPRGLED